MKINDEKKLVSVWLTNDEKNDEDLRAGLKDIYSEYSAKKYLVAVFESGREDLYDSTLALLRYNRQKCAENEVQKEKLRTVIS